MDSVSSASVSTNYGAYSDYSPSGSVSRETSEGETNSALNDSSTIGSFGSECGISELHDLYSQKAQAESELGEITAQKNDAQTKVNARRQEIVQNRQSGEEYSAENEALNSAQEAYAQTVSARAEAQQALSQIRQQSSANDQAINRNAQDQSRVSSNISELQSQLASLRATSQNHGDASGDSESGSAAAISSLDQSGLQSRIEVLQGELQQLKEEATGLQSTKAKLERELSSKQTEVQQLDTALQVVQASLDEFYQSKADGDAGIENDFAMDSELQELQSELQALQRQEAEKQAAVAEISTQISEAEANDEGLQAVREEAADREFHEAAEQTGFDAAGAEAAARSSIAQERYGKPYEELTEDEKLAIEGSVDGEVTLAAMELARQKLEADPDNAAAQAVIERGSKSLEAQAQLAQTRFNRSMENLPEPLREGAAAAMSEARNSAAEGTDPEAALAALTQYIVDNSGSADFTREELAALESILGVAGDYADALEAANRGSDIVDAAADSFAKSDLASMKAERAAQLGVSPDQLIVLSGTDGDDDIEIEEGENGGLCIYINGKEYNFTAEEAKYLIIDGGAGNDDFWNMEEVDFTQGLHIFGGAGDDYVDEFSGNNIIYGGAGNDAIKLGNGNNIINGGAGDDDIYRDTRNNSGNGNNLIIGGSGKDWIRCGNGHNIIFGGNGDDDIHCGDGNNYIDGGAGNDDILSGTGDDIILGGSGDDEIRVKGGNNLLLGEDGADHISGGTGSDIIDGGAGVDDIYGGQGAEDYAFIDAEDMVCLPNGQESLKISGQPGIIREFFDPEYVSGRLHIDDILPESYRSAPGTPEASGGVIDKGKEIYGDVKPYTKPAFGVKKLYNSVKLPTGALSKFLGVAGGLVSAYGGISDIVNGAQTGDTQKIVSGSLQTLSGGLAIAAVCCSGCPVAAAGLWAASGVCQLASYAVEYLADYMDEVAFVAMYLLCGDEMRSIAFEDQVRDLSVARYGDRLSLINSPQP